MSEMIERVAWAMREASDVTDCPMTFDLCVPLARAAIEAMREPTEGMVRVGGIAVWENGAKAVGKVSDWPTNDAKAAWEAMIEEALK